MTAGKGVPLEYRPLTPDLWDDFVELFGARGACGGCWCMYWRLTRREFEENQGRGNQEAMKAIVESGEVPGILAYVQGKAVGWCSVATRESFASLNRSPVLKRIDDRPVWSIVCLFVAKSQRGRGITQDLIRAAVFYVRDRGGGILEAYPTVPKGENVHPFSMYMGLPSMFEKAGFVERARPSGSKAIMRYERD